LLSTFRLLCQFAFEQRSEILRGIDPFNAFSLRIDIGFHLRRQFLEPVSMQNSWMPLSPNYETPVHAWLLTIPK